jgi:hypothetical protein
MARQVRVISNHHGTVVFAVVFRARALVLNMTLLFNRKSKSAVPGVVTTHDIRPCAESRSMLPTAKALGGKVNLAVTGRQVNAPEAVIVGPSAAPIASGDQKPDAIFMLPHSD